MVRSPSRWTFKGPAC